MTIRQLDIMVLRKPSIESYWPKMRQCITKHVAHGLDCQRYKLANRKPPRLMQTSTTNQRFEVLAIDLFGPLPTSKSGKRWIFIVEDTTSRVAGWNYFRWPTQPLKLGTSPVGGYIPALWFTPQNFKRRWCTVRFDRSSAAYILFGNQTILYSHVSRRN